MDETTKVLIGTISGFIIAFFAEPIKSFLGNKSKQKNFRYALYQELYSNCIALGSFQKPSNATIQLALRKECYLSCLTQDTMLYYQLEEAATFNVIYAYYSILSNLAESSKEDESEAARQAITQMLNQITTLFKNGNLDIKVMNRIDKSFLSHIKSSLKEDPDKN